MQTIFFSMAELRLLSGRYLGKASNSADARRVAAGELGLELTEVTPAVLSDAEFAAGTSVTVVIHQDPAEEILKGLLSPGPLSDGRRSIRLDSPPEDQDHQHLEALPQTLGRCYPELRELILIRQYLLQSLPRSVSGLRYLEVLHVENTGLRTLPSLESLGCLLVLKAPRNQLSRIPPLPRQVVHIDVTGNSRRLWCIPELVLSLPDLRTLRVGHNGVRTLATTTTSTSSPPELVAPSSLLTVFEAPGSSRLEVPTMAAVLAACHGLLYLDLSGCGLRDLGKAAPLLGAHQLKTLVLDRNKLQQIPKSACGRQLRCLRLSQNQLGSVPTALTECMELRVLDVSMNINLKTLPRGIGKLPNLEVVNIEGCYLVRLPPRCTKYAVGAGGMKR